MHQQETAFENIVGKGEIAHSKIELYSSLPNNKILDWSKFKAFADDKINLTQNLIFLNGRKHCGKRRKCWLPAFSPFPTMFSKAFFHRVIKIRDFVVMS